MLWHLTRKDIDPELYYIDENVAAIVRAASEADARFLANAEHGDEGPIWNDSALVDCESISPAGTPVVLLTRMG